MNNELSLKEIEIKLLLEAIYIKYGYDFRDYSKAHIKRRVARMLSRSGCDNISQMQHRLLYDKDFFEFLISDFFINVTTMFRNPCFYKEIRKNVVPHLRTYPFIKIWHAGCSTGEEVYSRAILLKEEGIYSRCWIYATDISDKALSQAENGIYDMKSIRQHTLNYQKTGGVKSFSKYYIAKYDAVKMRDSLKERIIFAKHNLATDWIFGEMHLIICRNVLIYFTKPLQNRVLKLFDQSLYNGGFPGLDSKENIVSYCSHKKFEIVEKNKNYIEKNKLIKINGGRII